MPNTMTWILMFIIVFHLGLNILAELTYFADRQFYKVKINFSPFWLLNYQSWWNCKNLEEYWRFWNLPVHSWFIRHLYNPLIKKGCNKKIAGFLIFLVSAIGHEYIISIAVGTPSYWIFSGMLAQFFVIVIERKTLRAFGLENSPFGNFSFWVSFCILGQPTLIFTYYVDYELTSNGISLHQRMKSVMDIAGVLTKG